MTESLRLFSVINSLQQRRERLLNWMWARCHTTRVWRISFLAAVGSCLFAIGASAATTALRVVVVDATDAPVANAVVELNSAEGSPSVVSGKEHIEIRQVNQSFDPPVIALPIGTTVRFPNLDRMRHHVYSFSEAKRFELRLYSGDEVPTLTFEKPGIIAIGCNIHDWMSGYIFVSEATSAGVTNEAGIVEFDVSDSPLTSVSVWHPSLPELITIPGPAYSEAASDELLIVIPQRVSSIGQSKPANDPLAELFKQKAERR